MKYIEDNFDNMLKDLGDLVKHNSKYSEDEKPFGKENRAVLLEAIRMMDEKGFKTENVDYYACYGEIGQGDKTIGLVAHLDVVPAGDGWDSDPFVLTRKGNLLYGRGVSDDKGAAVASMYALKYLKDTNYPLKKKVRLILGCNEETGSKCIKHYVEKYGSVDMGFTPDGGFPGIYAEKGMIGGLLVGKDSKIISINGGEARNIVCKKVVCEVLNSDYNQDKFKKYLDDNSIKYEIDGNKISVFGKAAHAASPDLGINAINYLLEALYYADINDDFVSFFHEFIGLTLHGEKMGFENLKDEATNTSINIGMIYKEDNEIKATVDIRFPIKSSVKACEELLIKAKKGKSEFIFLNGIEPLYYDQDSPMIKAMLKAYRDVTNDNVSQMEAIGGGTYAKSMNNIIAFGCEFNGKDNHIHDVNESLDIDDFKKQVEIYIEAIKNLNEV